MEREEQVFGGLFFRYVAKLHSGGGEGVGRSGDLNC